MTTIQARLAAALSRCYRVDRELGAGGMATVYLAHDLKHERDVAIKVLHPDLGAALGAERFLSEIKTTAKLQHPHILPLLDSGAADGLLYYVMPYVRGETLRARLERERQLPLEDALRIAREVAGALDHAHKQGIIHRDIKPENILLQDGAAVVADFGIALAVQSAGGQRLTQTGLSLGTPQYMSPEQATGERLIDARSDVYALGAVTYEMLAGEPPFSGPTVQAVVARLLADTPRSLAAQRKAVPPHVEAAVMRALEKLPADRFAQAAAFATALEDTSARAISRVAPRASSLSNPRRFTISALVGIAATAVACAGWWIGQRSSTGSGSDGRLVADLAMGGKSRPILGVTLSPDGRVVGIVGPDSTGVRVIRLRDLSSDSARIVPGSQGADAFAFAPDGKSLAFLGAGGTIRRISVEGGPSTVIAPQPGSFRTMLSWGADDWVYYTQRSGALSRVSASGGAPESITLLDSARHEFSHWDPQLLPGGKTLLFFSYAFPADSSRVEVVDLTTHRRQTLIRNAFFPRYVADGYLTFIRDGVVMAVRFDASSLRVDGEPVSILTNVASEQSAGVSGYTISDGGTLLYQPQSDVDVPQLVREISRDGRDGELVTVTGRWAEPRISPDGRFLALTQIGRLPQIWLLDRSRRVFSQLSHGAGASFSPNWAPDSRSLIHLTETPVFDVVRTPVDGSAVDKLLRSAIDKLPTSVGSDGRSWAFESQGQLFVVNGSDAPRVVAVNGNGRGTPVISPDGRWIAYTERAAVGASEIYVQSMTTPARRQLSSGGGGQPRWTKGGRELVYRQGDVVLASPFDPATGEPGVSVELFRRPSAGQVYGGRTAGFDVSPDGQRFYLVIPEQQERASTVRLVLNWRRDLERALGR
ncbi:protein kinase [Gemmatimonas sp.]|uniref:protein kinase domain-containing protein n=1 Tax=Gemmatimonas sp. TaxID=1962908 RepID=UPI00286C2FD6|nr:protein kinase [Gemmatimonas sp.]